MIETNVSSSRTYHFTSVSSLGKLLLALINTEVGVLKIKDVLELRPFHNENESRQKRK